MEAAAKSIQFSNVRMHLAEKQALRLGFQGAQSAGNIRVGKDRSPVVGGEAFTEVGDQTLH